MVDVIKALVTPHAMPTVLEILKDNPKGTELKVYTGSCHCNKFKYRFKYPSFEIRPPSTCNCSFCTIQAPVVAFGEQVENPLEWIEGSLDETAKYEWNKKQITWHFCPKCGVLLLWSGLSVFAVNARCLDEFAQIDLSQIKFNKLDGAKGLAGEPPSKQQKQTADARSGDKRTEPEPQPEAPFKVDLVSLNYTENPEGAEILTYKGGCHCRRFEFEYAYPRLDVRPPSVCNCSLCSKHMPLLAYGKASDNPFRWTTGSYADASKYQWNAKVVTWYFCPSCGSLLLWAGGGMMGVNVRCLDDFAQVDLSKFKLKNSDGASNPVVSSEDEQA